MKKYDYHILNDLHDAGLNIFSLSLHHFDKNVNSHIMGIDTGFQHTINQMNRSHLKKRLICVLQKSGINSIQSIKDYLDFAILNHIDQVTFKELYISSIYETDYALSKKNIYSMNNRVPLEMVLKFASEFNLEQIGSLPWGSPVFKYNNLSFCAYTEPSVGWEKHNKLARSWNLMSDGKCYASLEDNKSWPSCI